MTTPTTGFTRWLAFASCVLVGLTNEVSGGALSLSLRDATLALQASTPMMQLVLTLSKLLFGAFMLLGGVLGDSYGRRRVLVLGSAGLVAASAMAAVATTAPQLAVARALDGLANAAVGPLCLALAMSLFPEDQRSRTVALFLGISALGIALGPLAAGAVIQGFGWRAGFVTPALVAAVGGLGVHLFAPEVRGAAARRIDGLGALGVSVALLALVFAVIGAGNAGWGDRRVIQSLAVGAGALLAFVWWERRVKDPLLDVSLFRSGALNAALINGLLIALVIGGAILPLLYFFRNVRGLPAVPALLHIMPLVIAAALCSPVSATLLARRGPRPVILGGLLLIGAGSGALALLTDETSYRVIFVALVLIGAGYIAVATSVTAVVLASLPPERSGTAAALNNAAVQVGGALGAATLTSAFLGAARTEYAARLTPLGLSVERIREITRAWREGLQSSANAGARLLPEGMERHFEEAFQAAFTAGVARVFAIALGVTIVCAVLTSVGLTAPRPARPRSSGQRA